MIVSKRAEVQELIHTVKVNIEKSKDAVEEVIRKKNSLDALKTLKFDKCAYDPLDGEPKNFIEVINQAYSDLVVLYAVDKLLEKYPDKQFELHMGVLNGPDIESVDGTVIAECFATVTAFNNRKIQKDCEKLKGYDSTVDRYIFFYSREDTEEKIESYAQKNREITFIRIKDF